MLKSNRFTPSLQTLDAREVPAVVVNPLPDGTNELVITEGATADHILIRDIGNGNVYGFDNANTFSASNVTKITVNTEGGDDVVRYELLGTLQGRSQDVAVGLGSNFDPNAGNDRFEAWLHDGISIGNGGRLQIGADGGGGDDFLSVTAINVDVRPRGWMKTNIVGGFGDDTISQVYRYGEMDGTLAFRSWGLDGTDDIRQWMEFDAASSGLTAGLVYGGDGRDIASFMLFAPPAVTVQKAELYGDNGPVDAGYFDKLTATPNVTVFQ